MDALNPDTSMDAVTLRVGDLDRMSAYYAEALALEPARGADAAGARCTACSAAAPPRWCA